MSVSRKYGRTYHFPFSPGTTSDDRISHDYWQDVQRWKSGVLTEKLDGENTCLNKVGVFARSHAAPTLHKWADYLKIKWSSIRHDLNDLEIFGENLYAIHSIKYTELPSHFFVFAVRELDRWLSWEEVKFYANMLDLPTVPEKGTFVTKDINEEVQGYEMPAPIKSTTVTNMHNKKLTADTTEKQAGISYPLLSVVASSYHPMKYELFFFNFFRGDFKIILNNLKLKLQ